MQRAPLPLVTRALACALALAGLASPAGAASQGWALARSEHFVVAGNANDKQLRLVAHQFEEFRALLRSVTNLSVDAGRPVLVLALKDRSSFLELLPPSYRARGRAEVGGVFARGYVRHYAILRADVASWGEEGRELVYHEYAHLLHQANFGSSLPVWLNEGLATFYATAEIDEAQVRYGRVRPEQLGQARRNERRLPLANLFAVGRESPEYRHERHAPRFYAQSAVLTHYLLLGGPPARRQQLAEYMRLLRQGLPEPDARARSFGNLDALEVELASYVRQGEFRGRQVPHTPVGAAVTVTKLSEPEALSLQADIVLHGGQVDRALALAQSAVAHGDAAGARQVIARLRAERGRIVEGLAELKRAIELAPDDPVGLLLYGSCEDPRGSAGHDRARRERALRRAIELAPGYLPALGELAWLLEEAGQPEEALALFQRVRASEPQLPSWRLGTLRSLRALGRTAEAEPLERELLEAAVSDSSALGPMVRFLEEGGRSEEARALVARARGSQPPQVGQLLVVANHMIRIGRLDEAESVLREALVLRPDDAAVLNSLGYLNADRGLHLPEALAQIEQALNIWPDNTWMLDSRGWALFKLGRLAEAERDLRRALEGAPSAVALDHLGDVLSAQGRVSEAEAAWRQALEQRDATDERRTAIQRKLEPPAPEPAA